MKTGVAKKELNIDKYRHGKKLMSLNQRLEAMVISCILKNVLRLLCLEMMIKYSYVMIMCIRVIYFK